MLWLEFDEVDVMTGSLCYWVCDAQTSWKGLLSIENVEIRVSATRLDYCLSGEQSSGVHRPVTRRR